MTATIWHYTCDHGAPGIRRDGLVKPNPHPMLGGLPISWFTDLDPAHRFETGLTSNAITCDRMAYRFEVKDPTAVQWWPRAARALKVSRAMRFELEDGRLPMHWWVALEPVEVIT